MQNRVCRVAALLIMMIGSSAAGARGQATTSPGKGAATTQGVEAKSGLEAAQAYAKELTSGKGAAAIERFWDMDSMIDGAFKEDLAKISAADRAEIKQTFNAFFRAIYANNELVEFMAKSSARDFKADAADAQGVTAVSFVVVAPNGKELPNKLMMKSNDAGRWRVVDAQTGDKGTLVQTFHDGYQKVRGEMTPVQWVHVVMDAAIERGSRAVEPRRD